MKTLWLNCDDNGITYNKKNYLLRARDRLGITCVKDLKERVDDTPTDYILNIEPFSFKKGNIWTGLWEIDLLLDRPQLSASNWQVADDIFLAISTFPQQKDLVGRKDKTHLLFQACDPVIHKRNSTIQPVYDFVFCGTTGGGIYEERNRLMTKLKTKFTFQDYPKDKRPTDYISALSNAKVQFIRSMKSEIANGELAQRFFECLAIGPVLTNYVPDLELTGLIEGGDFFSYTTDREMMMKMNILIKDEEFRNKMAINGRNKAIMFHSYENRLISILNLLKDKYDF